MRLCVKHRPRPLGIAALSIFFVFGAAASFVSAVSLLFPGSFLEPMWRVNPRAREGFAGMGAWAVVLMCSLSLVCAAAAVGLWRGARWGYRLAVSLLAMNLLGDVINVILGTEPAAVVGIPVVIAIFTYLLSRRVRRFFASPAGVADESLQPLRRRG